MNQVKLNELIKEQSLVIPLYTLRIIKEFNLGNEEQLLLLYLYNKDKSFFDPNKICQDLNIDLMKLMEYISTLSDKKLLSISMIKDEKGIMQEVIDLSMLYEKITIKIIEILNTKEENGLNIHELVENEFARRLSQMEHEMIDEWEVEYSKELIKEAVKEASINGVTNLRYIDKILFDWKKQGIKNKDEIKKVKEEKNNEIKDEIYNCDWLNDDEDEEI